MKFNLISNKIAEIDVDTIILTCFMSDDSTNGLVHDTDVELNGKISDIYTLVQRSNFSTRSIIS